MLAAVLATPRIASAHGRLKTAVPAAGAHLAVAPREIRLTFSEVPELSFTTIQLVGPDGKNVALTALTYATDSKRAVVALIKGGMTAGTYFVKWQVAGADGHPVRDQFQFVIAPGASGLTMPGALEPRGDAGAMNIDSVTHQNPVSNPAGSGFGAGSWPYVIIRWLSFCALLLAIGAVAFRQLVLRFMRAKENPDSPMLGDAARSAARIGHRASLVLLVMLIMRLLAQSAAMHGNAGILDGSLVGAMLLKTVWGRGWILQLIGIVLAGFGFHRARKESGMSAASRTGWLIATLGAIIMAFSLGQAGHAASAPRLGALTLLADGLHVIGAGGWLGSLAIVLGAGIPAALALPERDRGPMVAELFNAFSPTALMFAGLVASTGVFAAWIHVGTFSAIWKTGYGQTLLVKLAILSVVALTGAYNWLKVKPSLGNMEGVVNIRRSARVEIAIGILVLLVTAILVAMPTSMDMTM